MEFWVVLGSVIGLAALLSGLLGGGERPRLALYPRRVAHKQARSLLASCLTNQQRAEFEDHEYFDVIGGASGRTYRIHSCRTANVHALDRHGRPLRAYCAVLRRGVPVEDQMLAQKLLLETDERRFLEIGVRAHRVR